MDSMLLLFLLSEIYPDRVRAIYVNHQLQRVSDDWAVFVENYCLAKNIPVIVQNVAVLSGNLENQAREARYRAFEQHLQANEILLLAHHQQDQAETLMLRLLSGAGVQGLSAMKMIDQREKITMWRPLLDLSREQICQWVRQLQIPYVNDPTNLDTHFDRAWCRQELWHILQSRFPKMQDALSRTSYLMQDADEILNEVLAQDLADCGHDRQLDLHKLKQLSKARQRQLLSVWMRGKSNYRPAYDMVERLQDEVIDAKVDAQGALHWNGFYYVRYQNVLHRLAQDIYLADQQPKPSDIHLKFELNQQIDLHSGQFKIESHDMGLSPELLGKVLNLRWRTGGEKIHLYGRVGTWPLKKAIQGAQIFPWMRQTIQILSIDNVMLGVFTPQGFWLAQSKYCEVGGWQPKLISSL